MRHIKMKVDNAEKFEKIYQAEGDNIFRFSLLRVGSREQALDITQETFLRLWKTFLEDKEVLSARAFLFTVCHRLIIDWYRKKKALSLEGLMAGAEYDPPEEKADNTVVGAEGRYLIEKIGELSEGLRTAVYLRFVEGLSPGEIGEILQISPNAASVRITRGLEELRQKTGYNKENI